MESKQKPGHFGDGETAMYNGCSKRSNTDNPLVSNEDDTTKRMKNYELVASTGSKSDGSNRQKNEKVEKINLTADDIPSEVLEVMLRNLATSDVVNCRQVNRKWNEISSRIMRQRADVQIVFSFLGGELTQVIQHPPRHTLLKDFWPLVNEVSSLSFSDLVDCLKQSKNFPFTSFRFKDVVKSDDIANFLSIYGQNIFALGLKIKEVNDVEMLRVSLEKTPNLKKLNIDFGSIDFCDEPTMETAVHLFVDSNEFQLPALNVLCVTGSCNYFSEIIADILKVASNLKCFEKCTLDKSDDSESITAKDLAVLQSRNKLHCLNDVDFLFKEELIDLVESLPQIMDLQLKSIKLSITWIWDDDRLSARATKIINKFFDSSKNSLQELTIPPLGLLSGLVIPKFENLQKLLLAHDESYEEYPGPSMFPPHFDMADHFPNLKELSVAFLTDDNYFSTYRPLQVIPTVELLRFVFETQYDETLMKLTPNVKTLLVGGTGDKPPTMNFRAIATHLKTLENLGWHIYGESQHDLQSNCVLDSIITGFSRTFCKKMSTHLRDKEHLAPQTIAAYEKHRKNFSILDLKALKRFDMSFFLERDSYGRFDCDAMCSCEESDCECSTDDDDDESCDMAGFYPDSNLYKKGLTKVSEFFAFDMMPDLDVNFISHYLR